LAGGVRDQFMLRAIIKRAGKIKTNASRKKSEDPLTVLSMSAPTSKNLLRRIATPNGIRRMKVKIVQ
jgi:hypothetical protein